MKNSDIRPLGAGDGIGYYWVAKGGSFGNHLTLVAINEMGEVTSTGLHKAWDDAAPHESEAVIQHLAGGLSQADADLERRREAAPEPEPDPEPPMDMATRRFLED
jgi:hypothetical protein